MYFNHIKLPQNKDACDQDNTCLIQFSFFELDRNSKQQLHQSIPSALYIIRM